MVLRAGTNVPAYITAILFKEGAINGYCDSHPADYSMQVCVTLVTLATVITIATLITIVTIVTVATVITIVTIITIVTSVTMTLLW